MKELDFVTAKFYCPYALADHNYCNVLYRDSGGYNRILFNGVVYMSVMQKKSVPTCYARFATVTLQNIIIKQQ